MNIYIEIYVWGIVIACDGDMMRYIGYSEREAERRFRAEFGLKGKHLNKVTTKYI